MRRSLILLVLLAGCATPIQANRVDPAEVQRALDALGAIGGPSILV